MPRRPSILAAGAASSILPLLLGANPAMAAEAVPGAPWWLPWALSVAGPVLTWVVYAAGSSAIGAAVGALRARAKALRAAAAKTSDPRDDVDAETQAAALEAGAQRLEDAARRLPGAGRE